MEDFSLVLNRLVDKDPEKIKITISENIKKEFEKTACNYLERGMIEEAVKVFAMTGNVERLRKIGEFCISKKQLDFAFKAFYFAKDKTGLDKVGEAFMRNGEIKNAFVSFQLAENKEMVDFLRKNLNDVCR